MTGCLDATELVNQRLNVPTLKRHSDVVNDSHVWRIPLFVMTEKKVQLMCVIFFFFVLSVEFHINVLGEPSPLSKIITGQKSCRGV